MNPDATVSGAFLFTDVEGSTAWWERNPELMQELMAHHDDELDRCTSLHGGELIKRTGDGMLALFPDASRAIAAAVDIQVALRGACDRALERTSGAFGFRVRAGIHTGDAVRRSGDLHGPAVHRAARVMAAGHGGQVLISGTALESISPASRPRHASFEALGLHRLRGLATPESLVRVHARGMETIDRPPSSMNAATGNLVPVGKTLIGREAELQAVMDGVRTGFVTTLVGPGGVGKTSLVKEVGALMRSTFPDGVWFADLTAMTTGGLVPFTVATMLGLPGRPEAQLAERVRAALTDGTLLLILDNCEHVVDEVAMLVEQIAPLHLSGSRVVCTSQRPVKLRAINQRTVAVAPLSVPTDDDDLDSFAATPSVNVFVDRVRDVRPDFVLSADNRGAVGAVCARLDGLPLALELAAARARVLDIQSIAQRLDQRFDLLRTRSDAHRHGALATTIAWSVDLLDEQQRRTFAALSAFAGQFDLQAAVAVLGAAEFDVIDDLAELVDRSLLSFDRGTYRLLSSIRDFGHTMLEALPDAHEYRSRHASWGLAFAQRHGANLTGDTFHDAQRQLRLHIDDLRAAFQFLVAHRPAESADMVNALAEFFLTGDYLEDAWSMSTASLSVVTDARARIDLLGLQSMFAWTAGRTADVAPIAQESIRLAGAHGLDFPSLAGVRLAVHHVFSGQPEEAEALARAAVAALGDDALLAARVLGAAAVVIGVRGDTATALHLAQQGVEASEQVGPIRLVSALANQLMILSKRSPQHLHAAERLAEISKSIGRLDGVGQALAAVADRLLADGDGRGALANISEAVAIMVRTGHSATVAGTIEKLLPAADALTDDEALIVLGATETLRHRLAEPGSDDQISVREARRETARARLGEGAEVLVEQGRRMSTVELVDYLRWLSADSQ